MDDKEFEQIMQTLQEYLEKEKTFVINPFRMKEFKRAVEIANELFYDHKRYSLHWHSGPRYRLV